MKENIFSLENSTFSLLNLTEEETKLYLNENKEDFKSLSTSEAIDFYARKWSKKAKFLLLKNDNAELLSLIVFYINVDRKRQLFNDQKDMKDILVAIRCVTYNH